jgi:hypothetical protein
VEGYSTMHATVLVLHVVSGSAGLLIAPFGLASPKRRGRHTRLGYAYLVAIAGVMLTSVGLAAFDWSRLWWLAVIGIATGAAAAAGLVIRLRHPPGWEPWHVSFMCGSYISLVTALLVVNFDSPLSWVLPTIVGSPVIAWAARRAALRSTPQWQISRNSHSTTN